MAQMQMRSCLGGKNQITRCDHVLRRIRDSGQIQTRCILIIIDHAPVHKIPVLAVGTDRNLQSCRRAEGLQRDARIHHALTILGDRGRSCVHHSGDIRQLLALLSLRDGADLHDMDRGKRRRLKSYIIDLVRRVDHRPRIRHGADRGIAAPGACLRSGPDVFLVGKSRIPQMSMQVNEAGHYPHAPGIDLDRCIGNNISGVPDSHRYLSSDRSRKRKILSDLYNLSAFNQDIRHPVRSGFRIQHPSVFYKDLHRSLLKSDSSLR